MATYSALQFPPSFDWQSWIDRWDRMQARYLVKRQERFDTIVQLIHEMKITVTTVVDLGCGTGSLTVRILEAFPEAQVIGIDLDPTLLPLARLRTAHCGERVQLLQRDLRDPAWIDDLLAPVDAVVSATALHWLNDRQLKQVYTHIAGILRPGGIFLNADHVGSDFPPLQQFWERHREDMRTIQRDPAAEEWETFINAYLSELGPEAREMRQQALGTWEGIEDGLPLAWHFDQLRSAGFRHVECFWRCDCDAIYGGFL